MLRSGKVSCLPCRELVVGDVLYFNIGEMLAVDGLMLSGSEVRVDESALTGESDPIRKQPF